MKVTPRSQRLAGGMESLISEFVARHTSPDVHGFVTVTGIEVSGDLQVCDVFVRSLSAPADWFKKLQKLEKRASHVLTTGLDKRQSMTLRFKKDASVDLVDKLQNKFGTL